MKKLECLVSHEPLTYTGKELRPHFILNHFSLKGDAIVAFVGGCSVETEALVDWEDRSSKSFIKSGLMVHFLGEFFGPSLSEIVTLQRLFIASVEEVLREMNRCSEITRNGDDLYVGNAREKRKLSVSIVTSSPVSQLFHLGINIDPTGAPVPAIGLQELGVDASSFAAKMLEGFSEEYSQIQWACAKVRPVM